MIVGRIRTKSAVLTEKVDTQSWKQRRFGKVSRRCGGLQVFVRGFCEMSFGCADERKRESETVPAMNGLLLSRVSESGRAAGCQKRESEWLEEISTISFRKGSGRKKQRHERMR